MTTIRMDEWLAEVERVNAKACKTDGFTSAELRDSTGFGKEKVLRLIHAGIKAGVIEYAGRAPRATICGAILMVQVYRRKASSKGK